MCANAQKTAGDLMAAIEPTLKALLSYENVLNTPLGQAAIAAYDTALTAVQNWQSGTPATEVLQVIAAFQAAFAAVTGPLNLPAPIVLLVNVILGGVTAVIGVLTANSPAPTQAAVSGADATPEESKAQYQAHVAADTAQKVAELVPTFKRSLWHSPATQYKRTWNETVAGNSLPASLKV